MTAKFTAPGTARRRNDGFVCEPRVCVTSAAAAVRIGMRFDSGDGVRAARNAAPKSKQ